VSSRNENGYTWVEWVRATCVDLYFGRPTADNPTVSVLSLAFHNDEDPADYHPSAGQFESFYAWCIRGGMKIVEQPGKVEAWKRNECPVKFFRDWRARVAGRKTPYTYTPSTLPSNTVVLDPFTLIGTNEWHLDRLPECERAGMAEHLRKQQEMRDLLANARDDFDNLPDAEPVGSIVVRPAR